MASSPESWGLNNETCMGGVDAGAEPHPHLHGSIREGMHCGGEHVKEGGSACMGDG